MTEGVRCPKNESCDATKCGHKYPHKYCPSCSTDCFVSSVDAGPCEPIEEPERVHIRFDARKVPAVKVEVPKIVPAREIPTHAGFFRKLGGEYVYLRMSPGSVNYLGLNPHMVYGICFTGNVAEMRPEDNVVQCDLFDMARNIYKEV